MNELVAAVRAGDSNAVVERLDALAMGQALQAAGAPTPAEMKPEQMGYFFAVGMANKLITEEAGIGFNAVTVRRINRSDDGAIVVTADHLDADGFQMKIRWTLEAHEQAWKVAEIEIVPLGLRFVQFGGAMLAAAEASGDPRGVRVLSRRLAELGNLLDAGYFNVADPLLTQLEQLDLSPALDDYLGFCRVVTLVGQGEFELALQRIDALGDRAQSMPMIDFMRGSSLVGLNRLAEARPLLHRYMEVVGPDADAWHMLGIIENLEGDVPASRAALERALTINPDAPEIVADYAALLEPGEEGAMNAVVLGMRAPEFTFAAAADLLWENENDRALEILAAGVRLVRPELAEPRYYLGVIAWLRDENARAIELLEGALEAAPSPDHRVRYREALEDVLVDEGRAVEAYRRSNDPATSFVRIAAELYRIVDVDQLASLVEARRAEGSPDFALQYAEGDLLLLNSRWEEAERTFAEALALPGGETASAADEVRISRVFARYKMGQWRSAYEELGPADETFRQLADLLEHDENGAELQQLVDRRRTDEPADPDLPWYAASAASIEKRWADVVTIMQPLSTGNADAAVDRERYLINALLELSRHDDAMEIAQASTARDGDPYFEYVVAVHGRDVNRALDLVEQLLARGYAPEELSSDPQLAEALADPAFAVLHEKLREAEAAG